VNVSCTVACIGAIIFLPRRILRNLISSSAEPIHPVRSLPWSVQPHVNCTSMLRGCVRIRQIGRSIHSLWRTGALTRSLQASCHVHRSRALAEFSCFPRPERLLSLSRDYFINVLVTVMQTRDAIRSTKHTRKFRRYFKMKGENFNTN
jgi:hypothetical protein